MYAFGHVGIGLRLATPLSHGLSKRWLIFGTLLPDLIDKSLFYGVRALSWEAAFPWLSGTRTVAHSTVFCLLLLLIAKLLPSKYKDYSTKMAAVALGVGTHLALDLFVDFHGAAPAVFWPFFGGSFPHYPHHGLLDHLRHGWRPILIWSELIGAVLLLQELLRKRLPRRA